MPVVTPTEPEDGMTEENVSLTVWFLDLRTSDTMSHVRIQLDCPEHIINIISDHWYAVSRHSYFPYTNNQGRIP